MSYPKFPIANGPGRRDLEMAFLSRDIGGRVMFTIFIDNQPMVVRLRICNFHFNTCDGSRYEVGGELTASPIDLEKLPLFNWVTAHYDCEGRNGTLELSNGE
jgi:hypothetical protein